MRERWRERRLVKDKRSTPIISWAAHFAFHFFICAGRLLPIMTTLLCWRVALAPASTDAPSIFLTFSNTC
jgi:hypothetical protein